MIRRVVENRELHGVLSSPNGVCISYLLFADDSLLLCQRLMDILGLYEVVSDQAINRQKTSLFFSRNTREEVKQTIQQMFGVRIMTDCEKYLGLPMACGKSKVTTFKEMQKRITKRDARHNLLFNYCNLLFLVFLCKNVILDLGDLFPYF